jgi:hypothetical protein
MPAMVGWNATWDDIVGGYGGFGVFYSGLSTPGYLHAVLTAEGDVTPSNPSDEHRYYRKVTTTLTGREDLGPFHLSDATTGSITVVEEMNEAGVVNLTPSGTMTVHIVGEDEHFGEEFTVTISVVDGDLQEEVTSGTQFRDYYPTYDFDILIDASTLVPHTYTWRICPAAYIFYKLWWDEKFTPSAGGDPVLAAKEFEVEEFSNGQTCIPDDVILNDNTTWPETDTYTSDDLVEIVNIRFSGLPDYEPPDDGGANGFPV